MRLRLNMILAGTAAILPACAAQAQTGPVGRLQLTMPAQDLPGALREISRRSARSIIAPAELVEGRHAPAISGSFAPEEAVRLLLAGSGLAVREVGSSLVIVSDAQDVGQPDPPERSAAGNRTEAGETIIVTGTHLRGAPATSPTILVTRDEIERSGAATVEEVMRKVPQNFQGGVNQENFAVVGAGADITEHGAGLNLRGLGQRATLVLVNGRRLAPSGAGSFSDVSMIPLSAVDRIEIVTDGASAIYGSDAVGGVVNFILRDRFEGLETALLASTTTSGGGREVSASATGGHAWSGGHILLSYEYRDAQPILASERSFTINLPSDSAIFPSERRHSLFAAFSQALSDGLKVEIQGEWSHRSTERSYFVAGTPLPVNASAEASSSTLSAGFEYHLAGDWRLGIGTLYSLSDTRETQVQPGAAIQLQNLFNARNELLEHDIKLDGSLLALPGGAVKLALGGSLRNEHHRDVFATGLQSPQWVVQERQVRALFAEASLPVFSSLNRTTGFERLILDGAIRYEDYDRLGSTVNPRVGALWSPISGVTLRGSYDTSFRAPLLSEMGGVYNAFYFPASIVSVTPAPSGDVALVMVGSNPDIRPERSRSWTVGVDLEPRFAPGLKLTATYYAIRFSNRIALPSPTVVVAGNPAYDPIVTRKPGSDLVARLVAGAAALRDISGPGFSNGGARPADVDLIVDLRFNNTAVSSTRGLDFALRYPFVLGSSRFLVQADANYILKFADQLTSAAPAIPGVNRPYRPVDLRLKAALSWVRGFWSANAAVNHADGYKDDRAPIVVPVGAFTTVDAGLAYEPARGGGWPGGLRLALTVQNLLAARPPRLLPDPGSTRGLGYDPVNATGRGRVVALQLRKSW